MTRLALGAMGRALNDPEERVVAEPGAARSIGLISEDSATAPRPRLVRVNSCRREMRRACSKIGSIWLISSVARPLLRDGLVKVQEHAGQRGVRRQPGLVELWIAGRLADRE